MKTLDKYIAISHCKKDYLSRRIAVNTRLVAAEKEYKQYRRLLLAEGELREKRAAIASQLNEFSSERVRNKVQEELSDIEERLFASSKKREGFDQELIAEWQKELDRFEDYSLQLVKDWQRRAILKSLAELGKKAAHVIIFFAGAITAYALLR